MRIDKQLNGKKILVAKLRHHGDVLLSSPVFSVLKGLYPDAEIDAYIYGETLPMLEGHPAISDFLLYDKGWKKLPVWKRFLKEMSLLRKIRKKKYDLVINLTEGDRGAIAAKVSKAPWAVGFDPEGDGMNKVLHSLDQTHAPSAPYCRKATRCLTRFRNISIVRRAGFDLFHPSRGRRKDGATPSRKVCPCSSSFSVDV